MNTERMQKTSSVKYFWGLTLTSVAVLAGCAITPQPLRESEQADLLRADRMRARENVEPIGPNLKLEEAIARGLKYNLDYRTKLMREAIAMGASQLSNYDMLPKIVSNAGYTFRNNSFITSATGAYDGSPSLSQPFVTSERSYGNAGISLNWSVLDFGVSYYEAQENADKVLVAAQERRKSMHSLEQDIIIAYLRAAAMQKLHDQILKAREQGQKALATRVKPAGMGFDLF